MANYEAHGEACVVCGISMPGCVCWHHVVRRKSGGSNSSRNLMALCQRHHIEAHQYTLRQFASTYSGVKKWLIENGWAQGSFGKWRGPSECYTNDHLKKPWEDKSYKIKKKISQRKHYLKKKASVLSDESGEDETQ